MKSMSGAFVTNEADVQYINIFFLMQCIFALR